MGTIPDSPASHSILKSDWQAVLVLIFIELILGIAIVRDYGLSWDEPQIYNYAAHSSNNYIRVFSGLPPSEFLKGRLDYYGPAFFLQAKLLSDLARALSIPWPQSTSWHFGYFLAFQIALPSLYFLCRKWASHWAAFGATLLFSTQPLLWGHAFINPKDIPFMAFFLAAVATGFAMVDRFSKESRVLNPTSARGYSAQEFWTKFTATEHREKRIISVLLAFLITCLLFFLTGLNRIILSRVVTAVFSADRSSLVGKWVERFAQNVDTVPVSSYVHKAVIISTWGISAIALFSLILAILAFYRIFPRPYKWLYSSLLMQFGRGAINGSTWPLILVAGILLGITVSIRVLGPWAGIVVLAYALLRARGRILGTLMLYFLVAGLVSYLTWPFLWGHPVGNFIQSLSVLSAYPFKSQVLFQGKTIPAPDLPVTYLPRLILLQLTEPVILFSFVGLIIAASRLLRDGTIWLLGLLLLWFVIPLFGIILRNSTVYDGFRQVFFIIPPLFILAGYAIDWVLAKLPLPGAKVAVIAIAILPGVFSILALHPYEYVYYNSFIGGLRGASRQYELDYWGTTYREAALFVNQVAPPGATVFVYGPLPVYQPYSRPDIKLLAPDDAAKESTDSRFAPQFAVMYTRNNLDLYACKDAETIKIIGREGAVLAVVKRVPIGQVGCP